MEKLMSDEELVYSIALFGGIHRIRFERPTAEELKEAVDAVFSLTANPTPEDFIRVGQRRRKLYDDMVQPYREDPHYLNDLFKGIVRKEIFGWGKENYIFNNSNVTVCPTN